MSGSGYTISLTRSARLALAEKLPIDVAAGAVEFFAGALSSDPHRVRPIHIGDAYRSH